MDRRTFLRSGAASIAAVAVGPAVWRAAMSAPAQSGVGPYGPLGPPDANGIQLPAGFTSRVVARSAEIVPNTADVWHVYPDGGATFALSDGGWIYVSNSEVPILGGVGAIRFASDGRVVAAYRVLAGTSANCAGGPTPWGTWLTCEEHDGGHVWECDPRGLNLNATAIRPALGTFSHEAVAVDPVRGHLYLTEDQPDGRLYRFVPASYPNLSAGTLQAAVLTPTSTNPADPRWQVTWANIPNPNVAPGRTPTRRQVPATAAFNGGEGMWYDSDHVYFTTKGDNRVWALNAATSELFLIYDDNLATSPVLTGVDNVVVNRAGEIIVAEDGGDMQLVIFSADHSTFAPLLKVTGQPGSELCGPAFSPAGDRLYFSSQRGGPNKLGITYEVRGPFHTSPPPPPPPADTGPVSKALHDVVEPAVRSISEPLGDIVHTVDQSLKNLGL